MPVFQGRTMHRFRPAELVIATGSIEQPLVFGNNDLPGVMLASGARRLVNQFRLMPGEQAVVLTSSDEGIEAALDLADGGVNVLAVADSRRRRRRQHRRGRRHRVPGRLSAVAGEGLEGGLGRRRHARRRAPHPAPATCWSCPAAASAQTALRQPGRRRHPLRPRPAPLPARRAARAACAWWALRPARPRPPARCRRRRRRPAASRSSASARTSPRRTSALSLDEGFSSLELSKRYTTVTMGPCQGRMCHRNSGLVIADSWASTPTPSGSA